MRVMNTKEISLPNNAIVSRVSMVSSFVVKIKNNIKDLGNKETLFLWEDIGQNWGQ